ncbi:MAG: restriction endonuclease subunit S [Nitrospiraceae bacterium]
MSESWTESPLSELATITMGQSPESSCVNTAESGLPFLQGCAEFGERVPTAKLHCSPPLRVAKAGSVLISVRAPVGTTNFADQDYCIGRGLGAVSAKQDMADNTFLLHAIEWNVGFLHRRSQGSTFLAIGSKELSDLPVPLLTLRAQRCIAEILSTVDEAINQTEALIAKYQQIKAGLMHDLFTRGVTPAGRLRPTRAEAPHLYKDSPLGWIPKEWEVKPLVEHVRIIDCKHYTPKFQTDGFPFIRPRNVKVDGLDLEGVDYVSEQDFQMLTDMHVPRLGDIVFSRNASFGVPCYIDTDLQFAIGQDCVIMTARTSDTRFVYSALINSNTASQIARVSSGSTFGRINLGEIRKLLIPHPGIEEERQIADRLFGCDKHCRMLKDELGKLGLQKHGLMHDLLTGRVRVKVAEPAQI